MDLYQVTLAIVNLLIGFRTFAGFCKKVYGKGHISVATLAKIGTIFVLYMMFLSQILKFESPFALILVLFPSILLFLFEKMWLRRRKNQMKSQFLDFLKIVHLKLGVGTSFRDSLRMTIAESELNFAKELNRMYDFVAFSQHNRQIEIYFGVQTLQQLQKIDRCTHDLSGKLKILIYKLQIEHDFRHRSGQILIGTKTQSYFLVFVYACSCFVSVQMYGFRNNLILLLISLTLFLIGFFWIETLGRNVRWKI